MLPVKVYGIVFRKSSAASVCWFCKARCTAWAQGSERARAEEHPLLVCKLPAKLILNNCLEYLFAIPVGYLEGFTVWNEFPSHCLPFFPAVKNFSKITCLAKLEAFFLRFWDTETILWPLCVRKAGAKTPDALKEEWGRTNLKIADRGKLMSRLVSYLISFLAIWCTSRQVQSWHSLKGNVPRGQMLLLQKRSQSWHLWALKAILQGAGWGQCSEVSRWDISCCTEILLTNECNLIIPTGRRDLRYWITQMHRSAFLSMPGLYSAFREGCASSCSVSGASQ